MAKTFNNEINGVEVSLGIQRLLIAEHPQSWDPNVNGRIDLENLPTGFIDLGAVVEDTPSFAVTRSKFSLAAGLPSVIQFQAVVGMEGSFEAALHSLSWRKVQYAMGNVSAISSTTLLSTIASVTDRNTVTFANTTDVESLTLGRQFTIAAVEAEFDKADATETRVASIHADGVTFSLLPTPIHTPSVNDVAGIYDVACLYVGTTKIREHVILGVTDFLDGTQVVHHFFKMTPGEEFTEEIRPTENARVPLAFDAFGVVRNDIPGISSSQLVLARRCYFPALDASC